VSLTVMASSARSRTPNLAVTVVAALFVLSVAVPGRVSTHPIDNRPVQLHWSTSTDSGGEDGSMYNVVREVGAPTYWWNGYTGAGVDVALIDSGVSPVPGLDRAGKIVYGPDVSFESNVDALRNLDTYGHGTHMAGIIAGRGDGFRGVAPGARIVSLKAANALGATSVGQVIAAIKWVVEHKTDNGLNIRVLNLSFGASNVNRYQVDDLAYAVEQAWEAGIAVVVSAGNSGDGSNGLADPAFDPFVIAVGADNPHGTTDVGDDNVTSFSSRGDGQRDPDVVAPGKSVLSLRVPGSYLDQTYPDARVGDTLFRGSGTSQAAAVVSGVAALVIQQRPRITPDQLKALLQSTAQPVPDASYQAQGSGLVSLTDAYRTSTTHTAQAWPPSSGSDGNPWADADATGNSWSSADANGNSWSTNVWTGSGWEGPGWTDGKSTDGNSWSSDGWLGVSWGKKKAGGKP
jgi:serine protease AprX